MIALTSSRIKQRMYITVPQSLPYRRACRDLRDPRSLATMTTRCTMGVHICVERLVLFHAVYEPSDIIPELKSITGLDPTHSVRCAAGISRLSPSPIPAMA